jgi:hypothetical protein
MNAPVSDDFGVVQLPGEGHLRKIDVLVVSSVALAFISFWRAAAIVLCDLASTAYYIGGISEQAIGKAAPWFIFGVMLFSYAVRAVYVESCTMFTRGGVYKVVKEAMGGSLAKLSVSALMFDYVLTGPISAVSAGQYIVGLFVEFLNLINAHHGQQPVDVSQYQARINFITVLISIAITVYFWRLNIRGIHESSDKALRIMQLTTVMAVIILGWSALTLISKVVHHQNLTIPPFHPVFTYTSKDPGRMPSAGWLQAFPKVLGALGILVAFGHSLLAMSGEESLAQVNRELEAPKLKNLLRAGFVIFLYSMLLTSLISFLAVAIIPDGKRVTTEIVYNGHAATKPGVDYQVVDFLRQGDDGKDWGYRLADDSGDYPVVTNEKIVVDPAIEHVERDNGGYRDNLIEGLCHYLLGPAWIKLVMAAFVVVVGFLILAGAVNTSIVGSNGVMNRLAEDGVLTPGFLKPHTKFGTTYRMINIIAILQLITIVASWGDVNTLGEAYAFGVIWSFVFKTMAMVVLRFKDKTPRQYEVPLNIRLGPKKAHRLATVEAGDHSNGNGHGPVSEAVHGGLGKGSTAATAVPDVNHIDLPIGITLIFLILLSTALINLVTKETATIWGVGFTVAFLSAFVILEQISHRRRGGHHGAHLEQFNEKASDKITPEVLGLNHPHPILVAIRNPKSLATLQRVLSETDTEKRDVVIVTCKTLPPMMQGITVQERSVDDNDRAVLTKVVTVTEEAGKQVFPLVLPTNNPLYAIATAARDLNASEVILGVSEKMNPDVQVEQFALAWGMAMADRKGEDIALTVHILGPGMDLKYDL